MLCASPVRSTDADGLQLRVHVMNGFLQAQEALRRAKFKIAGRQKIVVSRNWYVLMYCQNCISLLRLFVLVQVCRLWQCNPNNLLCAECLVSAYLLCTSRCSVSLIQYHTAACLDGHVLCITTSVAERVFHVSMLCLAHQLTADLDALISFTVCIIAGVSPSTPGMTTSSGRRRDV